MDPEQGVDDEFKNHRNTLFTWKMLKLISENDLTKFNNESRSYDIEQLALEYVSP